ncbi:MAG: hypothetical protein AB1499_16660, partial [Nitrospirota bacterium]
MNRFLAFLGNRKKCLKYILIILGILFISIGIAITWLRDWFIALGDSYAFDGHCSFCRTYLGLMKFLFIILGSFLLLPVLFEKNLIHVDKKLETRPKIALAILLILIFIALG